MKQIERQGVKTMLAKLANLTLSDHSDEEYDNSIIQSAISMFEDLGNSYHALQLENAKLKQDILQLEAMIED